MAHSAATSKNSLALLLAMLGLLGGGLFGLKEHFRNRASRVDLQKEADMLRGELEAKDVALLRLQRDLRQLQENTGVYPSHAAKNDGASAAELAAGQSNVSPRIGNSAATVNPVQNGLGEAAPDDPEPMRLKILEGIGIQGDQLANRSVDLAILQLDLAAKADELGIPMQVRSMDSAVASANPVYQRYAPYFLLRDEVAQAARIESSLRLRIEQERIHLGMAASHR
jgi:tRNA threonylcarbamoyladenosine modification (KEOPS) complex  Pcc1 subunit